MDFRIRRELASSTWRLLKILASVLLVLSGLSALIPMRSAYAEMSSQAIVNEAANWINRVPYCFDGGTPSGPSHGYGATTQEAEGATHCLSNSTVGFDCTGLTLYAVYQASGGAIRLPHDSSQATAAVQAGGHIITNESQLQPGDLVYFGGSFSDFLHSGIYVGSGNVVDANIAYRAGSATRPDGVHEEPLSWEYPFVGAVRLSTADIGSRGGIAFQANTTDLWTAVAAGTANHGLGMMRGTSPAIAAVPGGYEIAFQANTGYLWVEGPEGTGDLRLGMMPGTSPAIAQVPGGYEIAFQANTGDLWVAGAQGTGDLHLGMMRGTSPAIASCSGRFGIAFQANTGYLWTAGAAGTGNRGLGMMRGTSPSMACGSLGYGIAFQANTGNLWTTGAAGTGDHRLGMMAGTSPSIAAGAGGFGIAFQANTGNLWTTGAAGTGDHRLGMMAGTSPSIAGGSNYNIAFQANTGDLWTTGAIGTGDRHLGMLRGTSPAIA